MSINTQTLKNITNDATVHNFKEVYIPLVDTLAETYGNDCIVVYKQDLLSKSIQDFHIIMEAWKTQLCEYEQHIRECNATLFQCDIPCLHQLDIPNLWNNRKFSEKSKQYIWTYIQKLYNIVADQTKDIKPLPSFDTSNLHTSIPPSMLNSVKSVADKYSNLIENGDTQLEDLKINDICQELLQTINPKDFHQFAKNFQHMLPT